MISWLFTEFAIKMKAKIDAKIKNDFAINFILNFKKQLQQALKLLLFPFQLSESRPTSRGKDESKPTSVICFFADQTH